MKHSEIVRLVRTFIADQILEGDDEGLDEHTGLLELGVLNSMEILRLVTWLEDTFDVEVPPEVVVTENLRDITTISEMVARLRASA